MTESEGLNLLGNSVLFAKTERADASVMLVNPPNVPHMLVEACPIMLPATMTACHRWTSFTLL